MPDPTKPMRRSKKERMIAGVCGGIAEWLGWDPTLVRVLYILISLVTAAFPGLLAYILLWIVIPEQSEAPAPPAQQSRQ